MSQTVLLTRLGRWLTSIPSENIWVEIGDGNPFLLLEHLVGAGEQRRRHGEAEAERLRRLEVEH